MRFRLLLRELFENKKNSFFILFFEWTKKTRKKLF